MENGSEKRGLRGVGWGGRGGFRRLLRRSGNGAEAFLVFFLNIHIHIVKFGVILNIDS